MPKSAAEAIPNELLLYERRKRHWTRDDVVENMLNIEHDAGVDANTVGRWERGITEPTAHHLRLLTTLYKRSIEELGYVSADRIPFWNIESFSLPNPFFIGREDFLKKLHAVPTLRDEHRKQFPHKLPLQQPPQVLVGLGGIGKTQIALHYAYRYMSDYHTIVWLHADSLQTLRVDVTTMATLLNLAETYLTDQEQIITAVKQWLKNTTRWLLIFDNADDPKNIYPFIPSPCYGHILITTRSQSFAAEIGAQAVEVDVMAQAEALDFLLQRARIIDSTSSHTSALQTDRSMACTIVETLGRLPLALDQAGAYIQRTGCGLSRYFAVYQKEHEKLLHYPGTTVGYPHSIASTWSLNVEKVRETNPVAIDLLSLFAFLHPDNIPEALLIESSAQPGTALARIANEVTALDFASEELLRYSLVRRNPEARTYAIHRLVQTVVQDQMSKDMQRQWAEWAVQAVNQVFPDVKFATWPLCERYLSHAQTCVTHIAQWNVQSAGAARLLDQLGMYLLQHGQYSESEDLLRRGLELREYLFGPQHLEVADSLVNLGLLYFYQYQDTLAAPLYQRALEIDERCLGLNHPKLVRILHYQGHLYYDQDMYIQAESYYQRARVILEQTGEAEPGDLAANLSNLGLTYYKQQNYADAEPLIKQALEIDRQTLGADHPDVATQLTNLARLYHTQGKYAEAEPLLQRALTIREQALGPLALAVADSLRYLADCYRDQGKQANAEALLQRAMTIVRQHLAPSNPFRLEVVRTYHDLLREMGQEAKARRLLSQEK